MSWLANLLAGLFGKLIEGLADAWNARQAKREADAAQRELGARDSAQAQTDADRKARDAADAIRNRPAGTDDELFDRARAKGDKP